MTEKEEQLSLFLKERGIEVGDLRSFEMMYPKGFFYYAINIKTGERYNFTVGQKFPSFDTFIKYWGLGSVPFRETDVLRPLSERSDRTNHRNHTHNWKLCRDYFDEEKKLEQQQIMIEFFKKREDDKKRKKEEKLRSNF